MLLKALYLSNKVQMNYSQIANLLLFGYLFSFTALLKQAYSKVLKKQFNTFLAVLNYVKKILLNLLMLVLINVANVIFHI